VGLKIDDREFRSLWERGDAIAVKSAIWALNRVGRRLRTRSVRGIARQTGIAQKAIRRRVRARPASRRRIRVSLVVYSRPVAAVHAGRVRQTRSGVTAAGRQLPGAFIIEAQHRMAPGRAVVKRKTRARLPLRTETLEIHKTAVEVVQKVIDRAGQQLWAVEFPRILSYNLKRSAGIG